MEFVVMHHVFLSKYFATYRRNFSTFMRCFSKFLISDCHLLSIHLFFLAAKKWRGFQNETYVYVFNLYFQLLQRFDVNNSGNAEDSDHPSTNTWYISADKLFYISCGAPIASSLLTPFDKSCLQSHISRKDAFRGDACISQHRLWCNPLKFIFRLHFQTRLREMQLIFWNPFEAVDFWCVWAKFFFLLLFCSYSII